MELRDRYFYATVRIFHKNGKDKLCGKFIVVSTTMLGGKHYVEDKLLEQYPDFTRQEVKLLPIAGVQGMFIHRQPENQVKKKPAEEDIDICGTETCGYRNTLACSRKEAIKCPNYSKPKEKQISEKDS